MQFTFGQVNKGKMTPVQSMEVPDIWDLVDVGLGLLNSALEVEYCNGYLIKLFEQNGKSIVNSHFFSVLEIDRHLQAHIQHELKARGHWQGIIHKGVHALRIDIKRETVNVDTSTGSIHTDRYPLTVIEYSEDYQRLRELSAAKTLAEKTDKAKSQFLSHMSHELRTPLNAILGFTQLMQVADELSDIQQDNLKEIESAGNYLLTLINEILDLSRIESGKIKLTEENISLKSLFSECMALIKPLADKRKIHLDFELHTERQLQNDHVRLKQVLLNLLSNAVKYNKENGCVSLHCFDLDADSLRIEIHDNGPGIKTELQGSIFSPFERLGAEDKKIEGTGIGLMITRRLVQLMGGTIGLVSKHDRGSIFWLNLPAASAVPEGFQYFQEKLGDPTLTPLSEQNIVYAGNNKEFIDSLQQLTEIRPSYCIQIYPTLYDTLQVLNGRKNNCIILSQAAARELLLDPNSIKTLKHNRIIVVEDNNQTDSVDNNIFDTALAPEHSLSDILRALEASFISCR